MPLQGNDEETSFTCTCTIRAVFHHGRSPDQTLVYFQLKLKSIRLLQAHTVHVSINFMCVAISICCMDLCSTNLVFVENNWHHESTPTSGKSCSCHQLFQFRCIINPAEFLHTHIHVQVHNQRHTCTHTNIHKGRWSSHNMKLICTSSITQSRPCSLYMIYTTEGQKPEAMYIT